MPARFIEYNNIGKCERLCPAGRCALCCFWHILGPCVTRIQIRQRALQNGWNEEEIIGRQIGFLERYLVYVDIADCGTFHIGKRDAKEALLLGGRMLKQTCDERRSENARWQACTNLDVCLD